MTTDRRIGILAYGSLIDDPGSEIERAKLSVTKNVRTPFRIEFARSSTSRAGAPTLVPVDNGGSRTSAVIYHVALDEQAAADTLYRRELHAVGSGKRYQPPPARKANAIVIERFLNLDGFDVVLSTRIAANIKPLTARKLAELAIESARRLKDGKDGISYLIAAKANGIETPLMAKYEEEILKQLQAQNLGQTLASLRDN